MPRLQRHVVRLALGLALMIPAAWTQAGAPPLTLGEVEQLAVKDNPELEQKANEARAMGEEAVMAGELMDPKLAIGLNKLSDRDLRITPETMVELTVQQEFPPGDTLLHQRQRTQYLAGAEEAERQAREREARRMSREAFLMVWYLARAGEIVRANQKLFRQVEAITKASYASGRDNQQEVTEAQLQGSRLLDQEQELLAMEEAARAELAKWAGARAMQPLAKEFPRLPDPPEKGLIRERLTQHPMTAVYDARIEADRAGEKVALDQYRPTWMAQLGYEKQVEAETDMAGITRREGSFSAMVTVSLPLFTGDRQDRGLAASRHRLAATQSERGVVLRDLGSTLDGLHATWKRLAERSRLYDQRLVPEARANAQAALNAYQSGVSEFTPLIEAWRMELETSLEAVQLRVDHAKAQAGLLYLAGE